MLTQKNTKYSYARRILALPILFGVSFALLVNAKNIESLVEACSFNNWQVKIGKPLYSDSFGKINTPQGNYIGMQKYNALVIYEALK